MNITFLILTLGIITIIYLAQNLLGIKSRGMAFNYWSIGVILFLIFLEGLLQIFGLMQKFPHANLIGLPFKALLPVFLVRSIWRQYQKNAVLSSRLILIIPFLLTGVLLIPFHSKDAGDKALALEQDPIWLKITLISLVLFMTGLIWYSFRSFGQIRGSQSRERLVLISYILFALTLVLEVIYSSWIWQIDMISTVLIALIMIMSRSTELRAEKRSSEQMLDQLEKEIIQKELFKEPNLKLADLAGIMGKPAKDVSHSINTATKGNFNDYINEFRVREVKRLMQDPTNSKYTLEWISQMAGFQSSTSFNIAFKKQTGKTPSEYKRLTES